MMMRIQTGFRGVDGAAVGAHGPASPVSPGSGGGGGGVPLATMLGPASGGNDEDEVVAVAAVEAEEDDEEDDEEEEDYGVVVSRPQNRMLRDHEEERWVEDESYDQQQHQAPQQHQQQQQQQFAPPPHSPPMSPRPGATTTSPKLSLPNVHAIKVENALMALAPALPSLSSPHSPPFGPQYYHPNESSLSSSDGNQQTQGRGLSLTTRLRSMSSLGNLHVSPTSPASVGSPPLSALSSASPTGPPPSTPPTVLGNNKENVSGGGKESGGGGGGGKSGSGGGALSTLLLGIQKKAPKRKLVVSGVAMEDVDAYEAVKRWCEVGLFLLSCLHIFIRSFGCSLFGLCRMRVYHPR
jgi:hypothetical protein